MNKTLLKQAFVSPRHASFLLILLLALVAGGCQSLVTPPRLATATAQAQLPPTATPEPLVLAAPADSAPPATAEPIPAATGPNPSITVWINETSPEHEQV